MNAGAAQSRKSGKLGVPGQSQLRRENTLIFQYCTKSAPQRIEDASKLSLIEGS